jgi:hypothetical protein
MQSPYSTPACDGQDHTEWRFARLDDPHARLMAIRELPWFVQWWRGITTGKVDCGCPCSEATVGMIGAVRVDHDRLLTVTICNACYDRSPTFEDAGRAAVEAAEAGLLSSGRSFAHGVSGPEVVQ